jgi:hypothetical protein
VLEEHYRPGPDSGNGPSWLTFIGHLKDSYWRSAALVHKWNPEAEPGHKTPLEQTPG